MRIRPITSLERLCDAVTMIEAAFPRWSERTGRDFDHFARRFPSHSSLYFTLDDAAGTIGVALPTVDTDVVVLDTEFVAPSADSPSVRAIMAHAISAAAVSMDATRMAVPAGSQLAETYEEIGFAPTLFLQFDGARSRYWRQRAIAGPHGEAPCGARDVEVRVGSHLERTGLTVDRDCPDQVVSVLLSGPHAFVGVSKVDENLAVHADEHRRRSTWSRVVSRAQHKLEEAIDTFRIPVGRSTRVLDLGAAPGGWTALLLEAGATVVAVDPGALSPAVAAHPRVSHLRCRIEEVSLTCRPFGLIVNDMSLDPTESAALMCRAARTLESGGHAVMTIKLPSLRVHAHIREATRILEHAYDVMDVRHLFHNRQEVTAHLIRRDAIADGWQRHLVKRPG